MFYCLADSLNFAFRRFPISDLNQTFLLNILSYEQMFDRLATSTNKGFGGKRGAGVWGRLKTQGLFFISKDREN